MKTTEIAKDESQMSSANLMKDKARIWLTFGKTTELSKGKNRDKLELIIKAKSNEVN